MLLTVDIIHKSDQATNHIFLKINFLRKFIHRTMKKKNVSDTICSGVILLLLIVP